MLNPLWKEPEEPERLPMKTKVSAWRTCPSCGGVDIHFSRIQGREQFVSLVMRAYRCGTCNARFRRVTLDIDGLLISIGWVVLFVAFIALLWFALSRATQPPPLQSGESIARPA